MDAPPLLVSFSGLEHLVRAIGDNQFLNEPDDIRSLVAKRLPPVSSARALATLFGFSPRLILSMAARPHRYYRSFELSVGNKTRRIDAPRVVLKAIQSWFGHHLNRAIEWPSHVHGFVPGRSAVTAAASHLGADWVFSFDIRDFFPSISTDQVFDALSRLGFPKLGASIMAALTSISGRLPQGSPASPPLANLCFLDTDQLLFEAAAAYGARFARYADDLVFSGPGKFPKELRIDVTRVVEKGRWQIATEKTSLEEAPLPRHVHGILVHGKLMRLSKRYRNRIRMMQYASEKAQLDLETRRVYVGHIAYASSVYGGSLRKL